MNHKGYETPVDGNPPFEHDRPMSEDGSAGEPRSSARMRLRRERQAAARREPTPKPGKTRSFPTHK